MIDPQTIVNILNEFNDKDPLALQTLQCLLIPHNGSFVEHPNIVVRDSWRVPGQWNINFLGLMQGFMAGTGKFIAEMWSDDIDEQGCRQFQGYTLVDENEVTFK